MKVYLQEMTIQLRIILIILVFMSFLLFFHRIKGQKLALQYSLSWLILLSVLLVVTIFPEVLEIASRTAGIELPINMVFFLGFVFILMIIYNLTSAISRMSNEIKELTQRLALLEKKLHDDEKNK